MVKLHWGVHGVSVVQVSRFLWWQAAHSVQP